MARDIKIMPREIKRALAICLQERLNGRITELGVVEKAERVLELADLSRESFGIEIDTKWANTLVPLSAGEGYRLDVYLRIVLVNKLAEGYNRNLVARITRRGWDGARGCFGLTYTSDKVMRDFLDEAGTIEGDLTSLTSSGERAEVLLESSRKGHPYAVIAKVEKTVYDYSGDKAVPWIKMDRPLILVLGLTPAEVRDKIFPFEEGHIRYRLTPEGRLRAHRRQTYAAYFASQARKPQTDLLFTPRKAI